MHGFRPSRTALIVRVLEAVHAGRSPLVLTERTEHLEKPQRRFAAEIAHLVVLRGGLTLRCVWSVTTGASSGR
jgi:hypothetical protein